MTGLMIRIKRASNTAMSNTNLLHYKNTPIETNTEYKLNYTTLHSI